MGRKKIEIKNIGDQRARMVCFSKRRKGLFKKAEEFSRLYNVNIAGVVFSPAGKPFVLGDPRLFLNFSGSAAAVETETESRPSAFVDDISSLSLPQLQEYSLSLKKMRADIMKRLQNKDSTPSSSIRELSMNLVKTQLRILQDLQALSSTKGVFLVLHGASGLPEELIKGCIERGVRKFNVNTEVRKAYMESLSSPKKDLVHVMASAKEAMKAVVVEKMHLFGSAGKA